MTATTNTAAAGGITVPSTVAGPVWALLWITMAVSSIVFIEPAPFDLLAALLVAVLFTSGMRIPAGLGLPAFFAGIFIVANIVSIVFARPNSAQPLGYLVFYFAQTVYMFVLWVMFAALTVADRDRVMRIVWYGWAIAAVAAVALALAAYFRLVPGYENYMMMGRAKGPFKDPNVYGPFLIPVALWLLATMRGKPWTSVVTRIVLFGFLLVGLLLGFSRGSWGHFIASALVVAALEFMTGRNLKDYFRLLLAGGLVIGLCIALILAAIATPAISSMLFKRAALVQTYDVDPGGRFSNQRVIVAHIGNDPIGIGPNRSDTTFYRAPHNVYLKVVVENGWVGGVAFIAFLMLSLWRGLWFALTPSRHQTEFIVIYATVVGISAESIIIDSLHWRHFFVLLGLLWGLMLADDPGGGRPPRRAGVA